MNDAVTEFTEMAGWKDVLRPALQRRADAAKDMAIQCLLAGRADEATRHAWEAVIAADFIRMVESRLKDERTNLNPAGSK